MKLLKGKPVIGDTPAEVLEHANTKLTPELVDRLCLEALDTPSLSLIASRCRVPYSTLKRWLKMGSDGDPRYEFFVAEFEAHRAKHERRLLDSVDAIANNDDPRAQAARLNAAKFLLQKHFPKQYGDGMFVATVIEKQADGFDLSVLPRDELRTFLHMLKAVKAHNEGDNEREVKKRLARLSKGKDGDAET